MLEVPFKKPQAEPSIFDGLEQYKNSQGRSKKAQPARDNEPNPRRSIPAFNQLFQSKK